jgi:microcin C transport system substrate-binding protein
VIPTYSKAQYWIAYWNMYDRPKRVPKYDIGLDYWWVDPQKAQRVTRYLQQNQR